MFRLIYKRILRPKSLRIPAYRILICNELRRLSLRLSRGKVCKMGNERSGRRKDLWE